MPLATPHQLTDADRAEVAALVRRLGPARLARELGVDRASLSAIAARSERRGIRALVAAALPRLLRELEAHDARSRDGEGGSDAA